MIDPICTKCNEALKDFGAVLLSPPESPSNSRDQIVRKDHLCKDCYLLLLEWLYPGGIPKRLLN